MWQNYKFCDFKFQFGVQDWLWVNDTYTTNIYLGIFFYFNIFQLELFYTYLQNLERAHNFEGI